MTPREICLLLDHAARADLRQAVDKGFINRVHAKVRGVKLLEGLSLVEKSKTHKTMYRYEITDLGKIVSEYLPSRAAEWTHIMGKNPLVYGDGTIIEYDDVVRYPSVTRDYADVIRRVKQAEND